jgi:CHAT domain-containing protein
MAFGDPDYGNSGSSAGPVSSLQDRLSGGGFPRLDFSGAEVRRISAFIDEDRKDIRVRNRASEQELKRLPLQDYKIIHFAAHGVIDDRKPARSAIVLSTSGDEREDGFVQVREIYNLSLNADLVSLSACQTGLGQYVQGEGIEGLNRAFFYAGASSVMTSLWSINDQASAQLMERFYFHLRNRSNIMDALQTAKIEMIRSGVLSHPYYWGAFLITGNASRKPFQRPVSNGLIIALAFSLAMGLSVYWRVRSRGSRKSTP